MRAFGWFVGTLVAAGLITALIAYPVYDLTSQVAPWPFHRVASRVAMLVAAGGLTWLCRHLGVGSKRALGYGLPWRRFLKVALIAGIAGMATAAAGAALLLAMHWRVVAGSPSVLKLILVGLSSGIAVALIEETVMRGAMHSAIARESGQWAAALLTAPLFAVLHFFAKARIPVDQLHWGSGFDLLVRSFAPLGTPSLVFDSFTAWLAVSLVLSLTRVLTGNIAAAIGLHAGWVVVLRMLQEATRLARPPRDRRGWANSTAFSVTGCFPGAQPWDSRYGSHGRVGRLRSRADGDGANGAIAASRSRRSTGSSISK